jgi:vacuolar protein sorting-associated protein 13A/C
MLEDLIIKILSNKFGDILAGIDREHMNLSAWQGDIELNNVEIRPQAFDRLELPLALRFGRIGSLQARIPWNAIGSESVQVKLVG